MLAGKYWQIIRCKVEPCSMTGERGTCHLVPAGPHWICYGRLTWGGIRLCWYCTKESDTALAQDFQSGSVSFPLHPFPGLSGYGMGLHHCSSQHTQNMGIIVQGKKGKRGRRYLGVYNRDNHPCGKGSVWDITFFCLMRAGSVLLSGFVPLLDFGAMVEQPPASRSRWKSSKLLFLLPSLLPSLAILLALFLLLRSKSGCWQPAIQSQCTS